MLNSPVRDHDRRPGGATVPAELFGERYQALLELGRGSTGRLYLASDVTGGPRTVVKCASDQGLLLHEAEVLSRLRHPNLVKLKERYDTASPPFLVLELVDGIDFEAFLGARGGTLDEPTLGRLLLQLADTVAFVHARGFLHRDLKPGNILMRPDGSPVIVDFGAAQPMEQAGTAGLWSFVTEGYAAPEQYFADQPEGPWTDVYGLGALACRALCGHPPPAALIRAGGAPGEPLAVGAKAQPLREVIDRALEPDPADRPQTMALWRDSVASALEQVEGAHHPEHGGRAALQLDDYPPTVRVARMASTDLARQPAAQVSHPVARKPGRTASAVPIALALCLIAGLAAAGVYGWPLYQRHVKTEWRVDAGGGGDATTIADALARAGDHAIIKVGAGTYPESLRIERPVSLIALEGAAPIVAPRTGPCLLVTSREGTIAGLDLRAAPAETPPDPAAAPAACVILAGGAVTLENNRISGEGSPAILIRDGADPVVRGNRLEGAGLVVTAGGHGTITDNSIAGVAGSSLIVRGGADPSLSNNQIEGGGVVFAEGASGSFVGNRLLASDTTALQVTTGADPRILDNTIEGAKESGIFVYGGGRGRFEGNTIAGSGLSGVTIAGGGKPAFVSNTIRGSAEHGILVVEGARARLEGNQIVGNRGHGIALGPDSEVELEGNRLEDNDEPQLLDAR